MSATARLPSLPTVRLRVGAAGALRAAGMFWFLAALVGEAVFATTIAAFYGRAAARGDYEAWNRVMTHGHVAGQPVGNMIVGVHLAAAVVVILSGALQFAPSVRRAVPRLHRWNGRLYIVASCAVSLAGLEMLWVRGAIGNLWEHVGQSVDGVLIVLFAAVALRQALVRNFRSHGRWAMRLYLAVSASLFLRAGFVLTLPLGLDQDVSSGPVFTVLSFAQFVVPLAIYELYWRAGEHGGAAIRVAMASALVVLTLLLGGGIAGVIASMFAPELALAYENRVSVAEPMERAVAAGGIAEARRRYGAIRAMHPQPYDLSETELNRLGYRLLAAGRWQDAVGILRLNVEAYPRSGNVYDSLAEAYMDGGDKAQAISNYRISLSLTPDNANAVRMLRRLGAP